MTDLDALQQTGDAEPNDLIMTIIIIIAFSVMQYPSNTGFYKYDSAHLPGSRSRTEFV